MSEGSTGQTAAAMAGPSVTPTSSPASQPANDQGISSIDMATRNTSERTGTSYAWQHRHDLPGTPSSLDQPSITRSAFGDGDGGEQGQGSQGSDAAKAARRESFMVQRSRPVPVLRPSPQLALGSDRAAFNARWQREAEAANDRAARREAFEKARKAPDQNPTRSFNRTVRR